MQNNISRILSSLLLFILLSLSTKMNSQNGSEKIDSILRNHLIERYIGFGNDSSFIQNEYKNVILIKWSLSKIDNQGIISDVDICGFRFSEQEGIRSLFFKNQDSIKIFEVPNISTFRNQINEVNEFLEENNFQIERRIAVLENILELIKIN